MFILLGIIILYCRWYSTIPSLVSGLAAITDQLLLTVAELLQSEWQELGTALRIPPGDLHPILTSVRGRPEEWPYEMLTLWYSSLPLAAKRHWLQTLVQGLAKVGRNDLVRLAKMSEQGNKTISCFGNVSRY